MLWECINTLRARDCVKDIGVTQQSKLILLRSLKSTLYDATVSGNPRRADRTINVAIGEFNFTIDKSVPPKFCKSICLFSDPQNMLSIAHPFEHSRNMRNYHLVDEHDAPAGCQAAHALCRIMIYRCVQRFYMRAENPHATALTIHRRPVCVTPIFAVLSSFEQMNAKSGTPTGRGRPGQYREVRT